ncbi:MAG: CDP-diacylglycerol--glycerol-3-phosphate 3-phosphatidyltransferase [Parcubacteria group bacterium Gr01-1014_20]|nr:MAG: CDP-diacylglycerol--glycerol-3-phosphate 3-phosphatidyltransferase [Parcubacteria group bacterium Gr01-1014_20]
MKWKTWANLVTAFGFVGVGVYIWAYWNWKTEIILPVLILTAFTDGLDGYLARKLDQRTKLGWILDPIRDKAIMLAFLGNMAFVYGWVMTRSIGILLVFEAATFVVNARRGLPQPIHTLGKVRGFAHYFIAWLTILLMYHASPPMPWEAERLTLAMAGFSFLALIGYTFYPAKEIPHVS